ncbi:MAG: cyclic nucleotide-binding domain-containing protein [Treponema sp.]|jgi:CRP-like cAMP-binding protein|nr:cyclic nucleotide-binding domain-containing protein [Treponema sp.]
MKKKSCLAGYERCGTFNLYLVKYRLFWYNLTMVQPETLQKYSLFGGLMEEQIASIFPLMQHEDFDSDEFIITEGKPNDKIYFLIEGHVEVSKRDMVLTKFGEGEAFGEMEVLDVSSAIASIKSLSPVKVLSISNKSLREIYKIDVKIFSLMILNLARDLCRRLRKMDEKIAPSNIFI